MTRSGRLLGLTLCALLMAFTPPSSGAGRLPGGIGGTGRPQGGIGSAGRPPGGIGGTGVTAIGAIQRFGSIFVNGTEYHLRPTTRYRIDGHPATRDALHRGDTVFVEGYIRPERATAATVRVQHALVGVIEASSPHTRILRILGQKIHLTADTLVRPAVADLKVGTDVAVSALARAPGVWQATRVHVLKSRPHGAARRFLIRGRLQELTSTSARIGGVRFRLAGIQKGLATGHDVVARGWYQSGHPAIATLHTATTLADARGARVLIAGYFHGKAAAWRYEGSTLHARTPVPPPSGQPAFVVALRTASGHFVITQVTTSIQIMTFDLPSPMIAPAAAIHPTIVQPVMNPPSPIPPPTIVHPPLEMATPIMPALSRP